jgi:hypothetical protein
MPVSKETIKDTVYKVKGLRDGVQYKFRVKAINAMGISEPSPASEPFICGRTICKIFSFYFFSSAQQIILFLDLVC